MDTVDYTYVTFVDRSIPSVKERRRGILVGSDLAVTYANGSQSKYRVYGLTSGRPICKVSFNKLDQALEFARWLDKIYAEFFDLHLVYPEWDIIRMAQWTVPNGIQIKITIDELEKKDTITLADLHRAWNAAKTHVGEYTRER